MKSYKFLLFIVMVLAGVSCSDFLNKEPQTLTPETYYNTENELQNALLGVYSPLMQEHFYGSNYALYNAGGDDLTFFQRSSPTLSMICANANSSNAMITTFWRILYEGINRANILIENADRNTAISEASRNRIKAEALFLRSFYYFNLVQGWGDVPLHLSSTQSVYNLDAPRVDKQIIYDTIISNIVRAIPNLRKSDAVSYTGAASQSAAKGILARIYLFRAGECYRDDKTPGTEVQGYFAEAKRWAQEVKESNLHGLVKTYSRIFIDLSQDKYNSTGARESIWEAEEAGNRSTPEQAAGRLGNVLGFGSTVDYSSDATYRGQNGMANPGYSYQFGFASLKLYEMYESEGDTARADWNIAPFVYTYATTAPKQVTGRKYYFGKLRPTEVVPSGYSYTVETQANSDKAKTRCVGKFRREYEAITPKNKNYTPTNFPILRYSDVLLMLAEADNELTSSPSDLAYECLNAVRTRANITAYPSGSLTKDQFRTAIKKERGMELCFEGLRRWDLIRWGDFVKNMAEMQTYVDKTGWTSTLKYAGNYYKVSKAYNYFPIPDAEMSVNKAITKNNPGW